MTGGREYLQRLGVIGRHNLDELAEVVIPTRQDFCRPGAVCVVAMPLDKSVKTRRILFEMVEHQLTEIPIFAADQWFRLDRLKCDHRLIAPLRESSILIENV